MPKYEVEIKETEVYYFEEIEADSAEEAENKAWELLTATDSAKEEYHHNSDGASSATEIGGD